MKGIVYIHQHDFGRGPLLSGKSNKSILFSSEAACGYPYPDTPIFSPERLLTNCVLLGIDKVLLVKRDFYDWILSLYFQTLNEGRTWQLNEFVKANHAALKTWESATEQAMQALDGRGVASLIIRQEALLSDRDETIRQICDFIGCPAVEAVQESSNSTRCGTATIFAYRFLNRAYMNIICRALFRTIAKTPRKLIQRGRLGELTERVSRRRLSSSDIKVLF